MGITHGTDSSVILQSAYAAGWFGAGKLSRPLQGTSGLCIRRILRVVRARRSPAQVAHPC
jgi:hypothetical protein